MQHDAPTLDVQWLLPDGQVGGRHDKGTFKARGALPGDRIVVTGSRRRGRTLEVTDWAAERLVPRASYACPVVDRCGGCDLARMEPEARRDALLSMVRISLRLPRDHEVAWIAPEQSVRARIKLAVREGRVGYREARSHAFVPVDDCLVAHPLIREALPSLGLRTDSAVKSLELRTDGTRLVAVTEGRPTDDELRSIEHVAVGGKVVRGDPTLELRVAGTSLRASPLAFFQVNPAGNELLVRHILDNLVRIQPERLLDLYAGIGNLTAPLARHLRVPTVAVELEGQATRDLAVNAERNEVQIEVHTGDVGRFDTTRIPFDVVVLDPPRAGAPRVIDRLLVQRPRAIQLVSCHVPSAARDIRPALAAGYRVTDVAAVDLFPATHHVETLILLER